MTIGRGIAIAGIWIGVGVIAFGSPAVSAIGVLAAMVLTIGMLAQIN